MNRTSVWLGIAVGTLTFLVVAFFMIIVAISPSYACEVPVASPVRFPVLSRRRRRRHTTTAVQPRRQPAPHAHLDRPMEHQTSHQRGQYRGHGQSARYPTRGWVIALATAMQESTLRNLANSSVRGLDGLTSRGRRQTTTIPWDCSNNAASARWRRLLGNCERTHDSQHVGDEVLQRHAQSPQLADQVRDRCRANSATFGFSRRLRQMGIPGRHARDQTGGRDLDL